MSLINRIAFKTAGSATRLAVRPAAYVSKSYNYYSNQIEKRCHPCIL